MGKTFNERLKELREDNDLLQKEVAEKLDIRYNVYQRYEYGERLIPIDKLIKLAEMYNTSTDYILGLTDIKDPPPRHEQKNAFTTNRQSGDTSANKTSSL